MLKKLYLITIISLILFSGFGISLSQNIKINELEDNSTNIVKDEKIFTSNNFDYLIEEDIELNTDYPDDTFSFHREISGQKFWYVIKADFSEPTNTTIECNYNTDSNNSKSNFFFDLFHGSNCYFYGFERWCWNLSVDRYFQIHLGPLNKSYYHNDSGIQWWGIGSKKWGFRNLTGTYYLTYVAFSNYVTLNVWINTSKNSTFSTTQGTEVFKFERHDFFGNVNIGCKMGTFILNGKKEIQIKNSLFAIYDTWNIKNGFEIFKYSIPTGEINEKIQKDQNGISTIIRESEDFDKALWWGPSGKWTFMTTMRNLGYYGWSNIHLFGADIKLPE